MNKTKNIQRNKSLFDKWAKVYDLSLFQFWMKRFHKSILQIIDKQKSVKILDLSCGTGELLKELQGNTKLFGIDISEKMLNIARNKLSSSVTLAQVDVHELPYNHNSFDYVISTEAFHHYYDQPKAIAEMVRVAKQGGSIIIVDIDFVLNTIHRLFEKFEPGCVKVNNKKEMASLFRQAGLKKIAQKRSFMFAVMSIGKKDIVDPGLP